MIYYPGYFSPPAAKRSRVTANVASRQMAQSVKCRSDKPAVKKRATNGMGLSYRFTRSDKVYTTSGRGRADYAQNYARQTRRSVSAS